MTNETNLDLRRAAEQLAHRLDKHQLRIVFAESCTAGLVSATLAQVPGISQWHCGSAVVYRETTKTAWLAIPPAVIEKHGVVSPEIAQQMAAGVLQLTSEADISASITGHLGPDAPPELDGVAYIAIARREGNGAEYLATERIEMRSKSRVDRQREAAHAVLQQSASSVSD